MSATLTAERAMQEVQAEAEKIKNDETAVIGTVSKGDVIRQGDIYLVAIGAKPAHAKATTNRQLAPGSSQGSRHILQGECTVYTCKPEEVVALIRKSLPKADLHPVLIGPVIETTAQCELTHPEHGNRVLPDGEVFASVYQRAFAEEVRRQLD
jgi:hypothetical protein